MINLKPTTSQSASVLPFVGSSEGVGWHLEIPSGPKGRYRLAQLDDYSDFPRRDFPRHPPITISLSVRASAPEIPGTWGFGLWNDPFSLSLGVGGGVRRFPALPNAAWFFHASPQNYLSFQDDKPAQGFLAQSFQSPSIPKAILALGSLLIPLLAWSFTARGIRASLSRIIQEDSALCTVDMTHWHTYSLRWTTSQVLYEIDGIKVFQTMVTPTEPLGLVIWIDNQYASFPPSGKMAYGTSKNIEPAWIEIKDIESSFK